MMDAEGILHQMVEMKAVDDVTAHITRTCWFFIMDTTKKDSVYYLSTTLKSLKFSGCFYDKFSCWFCRMNIDFDYDGYIGRIRKVLIGKIIVGYVWLNQLRTRRQA